MFDIILQITQAVTIAGDVDDPLVGMRKVILGPSIAEFEKAVLTHSEQQRMLHGPTSTYAAVLTLKTGLSGPTSPRPG